VGNKKGREKKNIFKRLKRILGEKENVSRKKKKCFFSCKKKFFLIKMTADKWLLNG
jgi:hypothetical protein